VCVCMRVCACVQNIDGPGDGSSKWLWKELEPSVGITVPAFAIGSYS